MTSEPTARDRSAPFADVREVINRLDPENLLALGAPIDEYDPEVDELARRIRSGEMMTDDLVRSVWERWFGEASGLTTRRPHAELHELAARLEALRAEHLGARLFPLS